MASRPRRADDGRATVTVEISLGAPERTHYPDSPYGRRSGGGGVRGERIDP
jgi:hypothetical protein